MICLEAGQPYPTKRLNMLVHKIRGPLELSTKVIFRSEGLLGFCVLSGLDCCFSQALEDNNNLLDRVCCRTCLLYLSLLGGNPTFARYFLRELHVYPNSPIRDLCSDYSELQTSDDSPEVPSVWMLFLLTVAGNPHCIYHRPHFLPERRSMYTPEQIYQLLRELLESGPDPTISIPLPVKAEGSIKLVPLRLFIQDHLDALDPTNKDALLQLLSRDSSHKLSRNERWKRRLLSWKRWVSGWQ